MHELQSLLLQKLPRLGELTFWCLVKHPEFEIKRILEVWKNYWRDKFEWEKSVLLQDTKFANHCSSKYGDTPEKALKWYEILGHPFTHADILEALGEDWAMTGGYQLLRKEAWVFIDSTYIFEADNQWFEKLPKLPSNISDLSLPEYEETRKQLIQLLTK